MAHSSLGPALQLQVCTRVPDDVPLARTSRQLLALFAGVNSYVVPVETAFQACAGEPLHGVRITADPLAAPEAVRQLAPSVARL